MLLKYSWLHILLWLVFAGGWYAWLAWGFAGGALLALVAAALLVGHARRREQGWRVEDGGMPARVLRGEAGARLRGEGGKRTAALGKPKERGETTEEEKRKRLNAFLRQW